MILKHATQTEWTEGTYAGSERAMLRTTPEGGYAALIRLKAGAKGFKHTHISGEDAFVVSGLVDISGKKLGPGDYLYTEPGEIHQLVALEDSMVYVFTEKPVKVLE